MSLTAVSVGVVLAPVPSGARLVAGLLLSLILPGYGLTSLLLAKRTLERAEWVLCVLGFSMVAAVLGGLLLNFAPGHLGRPAWAIFSGSLILICVGWADLRNTGSVRTASAALGPVGDFVDAECPPTQKVRAGRHRHSVPNKAAVVVGLAALGVTVCALSIAVSASTSQSPPLALWLRPTGALLLQVGVTPGATAASGLTLVVREGATVTRLRVPQLRSAQTYKTELTVPRGTLEVVVELDSGSKQLRHVHYWYSGIRTP